MAYAYYEAITVGTFCKKAIEELVPQARKRYFDRKVRKYVRDATERYDRSCKRCWLRRVLFKPKPVPTFEEASEILKNDRDNYFHLSSFDWAESAYDDEIFYFTSILNMCMSCADGKILLSKIDVEYIFKWGFKLDNEKVSKFEGELGCLEESENE